MFRIIPSMLLRNKRLVKGKKFKNHEDAGNPFTTSRIYNDQLADEIIILDIDATQKNDEPDFETLKKVAQNCFIPISFGGGIRNLETASKAFLNGADKIVLNSSAFKNVSLIRDITRKYGKQAVVCSLDYKKVKNKKIVFINNGSTSTGMDLETACKIMSKKGVGEFFLTDIDKEGMRTGTDINFIDKLGSKIDVPIIINGGIGVLDDFLAVAMTKTINAISAGRVFQFSDFNLIKVRRFLLQNKIKTRKF